MKAPAHHQKFLLVIVALFSCFKVAESVFGNYGYNSPIVFPMNPRFGPPGPPGPPHPMMNWNRRNAEWLPPGHFPKFGHGFDDDDDSSEEEEDFDNSTCPGGWSGGKRWPCVPSKNCTTLRPRGFRTYCGYRGGEPLVCCPPAQKESIHADIGVPVRSYKPKIEQKCGLLVPENNQNNKPFFNNNFAFGPKYPGAPEPLIGGVPLRTAQSSPWMAAIGERTKNGLDWYCGGSLIAAQWVVTAAHCVVRRKADAVRLGELDFSRTDEPASPKDMVVVKVEVHPDYKPPVYYHDIALVKLRENAPFSKYIQPVCLPPPNLKILDGAIATLSGWGDTEFGGDRSDVLQEVGVPILPNDRCTASYSRRTIALRNYPEGITGNLLCAGDLENGGRDACQGDSGAPLVMREGNVHSLVGVVSTGVGCGSRNYPGVYVRISNYTEWIKNVIR